jgi:hypothetical protein
MARPLAKGDDHNESDSEKKKSPQKGADLPKKCSSEREGGSEVGT